MESSRQEAGNPKSRAACAPSSAAHPTHGNVRSAIIRRCDATSPSTASQVVGNLSSWRRTASGRPERYGLAAQRPRRHDPSPPDGVRPPPVGRPRRPTKPDRPAPPSLIQHRINQSDLLHRSSVLRSWHTRDFRSLPRAAAPTKRTSQLGSQSLASDRSERAYGSGLGRVAQPKGYQPLTRTWTRALSFDRCDTGGVDLEGDRRAGASG